MFTLYRIAFAKAPTKTIPDRTSVYTRGKGKGALQPKAQAAGAYPGLLSMKRA